MNNDDKRPELIQLTDQAIDWRHDTDSRQDAGSDHWLLRLLRRLFRSSYPPGMDDAPRKPPF